jgi:adrenodoxin-NADP+ reductase
MKLPSVSFDPIEAELLPPDISKLPRASKRIMQVLEKGSGTTPSSAAKSWSLDFRLSPSKFNGDSLGSLKSVSFQRTSLEPDVFDPYAKTSYTGESVDLQANLAFRSIGYKSEALKGLSELGVPFDDRLGIIPNDQYGRVMQPTKDPGDPFPARHVPGMYSAGWVKRGPTGVIASTMNDAFATADAIADDWHSHALFIESRAGEARKLGWDGVKGEAVKTGLRRVSWQDWEKIDEAEMERGKAKGKEREKFTTVADMLRILD